MKNEALYTCTLDIGKRKKVRPYLQQDRTRPDAGHLSKEPVCLGLKTSQVLWVFKTKSRKAPCNWGKVTTLTRTRP